MAGTGKRALIVGPGFIGLNILDLLVHENFQVTGIVRRSEHAEQVEHLGATSVIGDLDDVPLITQQAIEHDIIFHTATADHISSVEAICQGVAERANQGKSTIYIHTSGASLLDDQSHGNYETSKIYYDNKPEDIAALPPTAPHRKIDLTVVNWGKRLGEKAKIAIIIPPIIYGYNSNHKRLTIQIPTLTRFALKHGYAGFVGKGLSVESSIHVLDLARAFMVLLHYMESSDSRIFIENPYFFCDSGQDHSWRSFGEMIGKGLHKAGKIADPTPKSIPKDMFGWLFGDHTYPVAGLNSRSRGVRLRELGWEPSELIPRALLHDQVTSGP
ncbi:uncharacterized protein PV07_11318 [Cladophialophora immunda]|uniref:NAD(P)-binding domain-containing protein n=1 Tax=Cladophialophora immunda TaxID=569365 RepID=A0A0D2ADW4_9EURO|nr:uncharacterized protein PV07_11318 [Cladophialophora immunda]KIW23092.1 hypothetical protein PV07_11318 [Cladophialophora immunda]